MTPVQTRNPPEEGRAGRLYLDALGVTVASLGELECALKPRLEITSERYGRFIALDDEVLASAAVTTQRAVDFLQRTLLSLRDDVPRINQVLEEIPLSFFTEDHAWRILFDELRKVHAQYEDFKLLALARYRGYLVGCMNALNRISDERLQSAIGGDLRAASEDTSEFHLTRHRSYDSARSSREVIVRDLVRLPKGTTLALNSDLDSSLDLWFAKRRFRIETLSGLALVDERGRSVAFRDGRNTVGRGLYNDVVVDPDFREVSRRHAIIDTCDGVIVAVTDLSALGTFISRARIRGAL